MKITFILNVMERSGGVRAVLEHADHLLSRNHQVYVVYPALNLAHVKKLSLRGFASWLLVNVWQELQYATRVGRLQPFVTNAQLIRIPVLQPRFIKLVEKLIPNADVVIATAWQTAYCVDKLSSNKGHKFYFVQNYEIWDVWNEIECWNEARKHKRSNETFACSMARIIPKKKNLRDAKTSVDGSYRLPLRKVTIAGWLRQVIEGFGERLDDVIPNGVNFNIFFKEDDRRDKTQRVNVLMPFRLAAWKGLNDGIDAFRQIHARHPDTNFSVFGHKPPADNPQLAKIPKWVKFHDSMSDAALRALYSETDVFVLPSWIEGFPLPPMEAMACGCAVVTTDAGGFSDYIKDGETALVVPVQNPDALAKSVCWLIENDYERRRIADNGYRFVQQFTWENATEKLEATLKKAVHS
jgi:glycosyltransferase involved in cell wall biosynthesis